MSAVCARTTTILCEALTTYNNGMTEVGKVIRQGSSTTFKEKGSPNRSRTMGTVTRDPATSILSKVSQKPVNKPITVHEYSVAQQRTGPEPVFRSSPRFHWDFRISTTFPAL